MANAAIPADANPYAYAACNGVNYTDPFGLAVDWRFIANLALGNPFAKMSPENFVIAGIGGDILSTGAYAATFGPSGAAAGLPLVAAGGFLVGYALYRQCRI